jgi:hypothetical protein
MKAINAIYKHRHLYNVVTGKRIILNENSEVSITVQDTALLKTDPYNPPHKALLTMDELLSNIKLKKLFHKLLFKKGTKLWFNIKAGVKVNKSKSSTGPYEEEDKIVDAGAVYQLEIELNEDLFWVSKQKEPTMADVFECACTVIGETSNAIEFFEPIYATSLNQAYTKTFEFYFPLYASASANVYKKISRRQHYDDYLQNFRMGNQLEE